MTTHNKVYLVVKIGDQNNEGGFRHGMPVSVHLDRRTISNWMKTVFAIFEIDSHYREKLFNIMKPIEVNGVTIPRSAYFDIDRYLNDRNLQYLMNQWLSPAPVEPHAIRVNNPEDYILYDIEDYYFSELSVPDNNAITSGNYTVGPNMDYATFIEAFADIGNLTGNLTLTQQGTVVHDFTADVTFDLNGFKFTITNAWKHNGIPLFSCSSIIAGDNLGNHHMRMRVNGSNGEVDINGLHFLDDERPLGNNTYSLTINNQNSNGIINVRDCIFQDGPNQTGKSGLYFQNNGVGQIFRAWNCLFIRKGRSIEVNYSQTVLELTIENCTFYDTSGYIRANTTIRNCLFIKDLKPSIGWSEQAVQPQPTSVGNLVCSSDGLLNTFPISQMNDYSPNYTGELASNHIASLDPQSPDFCKTINAGLVGASGVATLIASNDTGIRGNPRPTI